MFSVVLLELGQVLVVVVLVVLTIGAWALAVGARAKARKANAAASENQGFHLLVEQSADPVIIVDRKGLLTYVNPSAREMFGYGDDQTGVSALDMLHPDEREDAVERIILGAAGDPLDGVILRRVRTESGRWIRCETVSTNMLEEPSVNGIVIVLRDVSERLAAEDAAAAEHAFTQAILDTTTALVVTSTLDGRLVSLNRAAEELTGYKTEEVIGRNVIMFVPEEDRERWMATTPRTLEELPVTEEHHWAGRRGERHLVAWTNAIVRDRRGRPVSIVATGIDVTETRRAELAARSAEQREHDRLAWDATHDALTNLLNRAGLLDQLDHFLGDPSDHPVAVLFLDLDEFKTINDDHGHAVGDKVLRVVGQRLVDAVRGGDAVGRLGGDEFVILCPTLTTELAKVTARRIEEAVAAPIALDGLQLLCGASTGVVVNQGEDAPTLLDRADAAMYEVKRGRRRDGGPIS